MAPMGGHVPDQLVERRLMRALLHKAEVRVATFEHLVRKLDEEIPELLWVKTAFGQQPPSPVGGEAGPAVPLFALATTGIFVRKGDSSEACSPLWSATALPAAPLSSYPSDERGDHDRWRLHQWPRRRAQGLLRQSTAFRDVRLFPSSRASLVRVPGPLPPIACRRGAIVAAQG